MLSEFTSLSHKDLAPDWANWIALDADSALWTYEAKPIQHLKGWYENELGCNRKLASVRNYRKLAKYSHKTVSYVLKLCDNLRCVKWEKCRVSKMYRF